jgi:hypothetical protein
MTDINLAELCKWATVKANAVAQLSPQHTPRSFFDQLLRQRDYSNCIRLLPHLLPARVAIWWGCQCVWDVFAPVPPANVMKTLQKVTRWAVDPSEDSRLGVGMETASEAHEAMDTSHGCLAVAVRWSSGSLLPPGWPELGPPGYASPRLVSGAILRAAVEREPMEYMEHYRQFLDLGMHLVARRNLWVPAPATIAEPRLEEMFASLTLAAGR